jgi:hypothetical protein
MMNARIACVSSAVSAEANDAMPRSANAWCVRPFSPWHAAQ